MPTDIEWEKAARGTDGRLYPWGDTFDCHNGNFADTGWGAITVTGGLNCDGYNGFSPVDAFPNGVSPYGIFNMVGNIPEFVSSQFSRGGSMRYDRYSNFGYISAVAKTYGESGVRCAFTP